MEEAQSIPSDTQVSQITESGDGYKWPELRFDIPPHRFYHFSHQFRNSSNPNNFLKGIKWSPDGSCFLTNSEDNTLRVFDLPDKNRDTNENAYLPAADEDPYASNLLVSEGESVYDYCWYPYMHSSDPTTCVFASTTRDHPIHLWDAIAGQLRCTYRAYDSMDEITAAFSVAFNPSGTKIFAGYNKSIRVFDIHRPGRDFEHYSATQGNKDGQSGILSSIAFSPSHNGMLAMGSYSQTTAIYAEENMELLYILHGQVGGVTQVLFSKDGNYLYTGGRKDPYILCWDIRNTAGIVYKLYRSTEYTNQRILFDIEPCGRHLGTGGQDGLVHIYDLQNGQWVSSFQAASDTVNGFCFHPYLPMAASSSGHRRFGTPDGCDDILSLSGEENCATVWGFSCSSVADSSENVNYEELNGRTECEDPNNIQRQDP
ncbi:transducin/WD40 repeat-like superfamily protein [Tasmannia lanceolata]|uniref:transducin/WD40 repeat-like superfamily protein n=1 Tax=Tasmannia lanceolata TaxID=3420 RepID=UPI0040636215